MAILDVTLLTLLGDLATICLSLEESMHQRVIVVCSTRLSVQDITDNFELRCIHIGRSLQQLLNGRGVALWAQHLKCGGKPSQGARGLGLLCGVLVVSSELVRWGRSHCGAELGLLRC